MIYLYGNNLNFFDRVPTVTGVAPKKLVIPELKLPVSI